MVEPDPAAGPDIAVIGMAGRFPGADDVAAFWRLIREGRPAIRKLAPDELDRLGVPAAERNDPRYVAVVAPLDGAEEFDAAFFGFSPREAELLDPQQRVFLECAWTALEDAGYSPDGCSGSVGVFAGATSSTYLLFNLASRPELLAGEAGYQIFVGNTGHLLASRVSYKLDLRGPSFAVQSACSTSLLAVHLACQSLLNGECDLALAGGVSINLAYAGGYRYVEGSILSPDGSCSPFDARARGTVFGSGVGAVVLKPLARALADGDCVRAVIRGSAVSNDGRLKVGFTAPGVEGQTAAIIEALAAGGVTADEIGYVEAHGTGTSLGDPLEIQALTQAFRVSTGRKGYCAIGAVKELVGHLDAAAGVAGLIKTILCLQNKQIPPSATFEQPNPQIDFAQSPVYVNRVLSDWPSAGRPRRAGVSSFGLGGTNVHAVLEEAPPTPAAPARSRGRELLVLSARTPAALDTAAGRLAAHLRTHPQADLRDVAWTLQTGRHAFRHRRVLVATDAVGAAQALEDGDAAWPPISAEADEQRQPSVAFIFPGQGAQYVGMGAELYETDATFREQIDLSARLLQPQLGLDPRGMLRAEGPQAEEAARVLTEMQVAQAWLFAVEHALARTWMAWGIKPEALMGHSVGEYVAACLAGVFTLPTALSLVATRGRLMQSCPPGAMMAVALGSDEVGAVLDLQHLSIAAINEKNQCVVSGAIFAIDAAAALLQGKGITCTRLAVACASHSPLMEPVLAEFREHVARAQPRPPELPVVSNVTGTWLKAEEATDPGYWAGHLRQPVRFIDGLETLRQAPGRVFLEVGPGQGLAGILRRAGERNVAASLPPSAQRPHEVAAMLQGLGQLWLAGVRVDWSRQHPLARPRRVPLPTYPFERRRYWVSALRRSGSAEEAWPAAQELHPRLEPDATWVAPRSDLEREMAALWQKLLGLAQVGALDNFYLVGGDSLLATQLASRVRTLYGAELPLRRLLEQPTVEAMASLLVESVAEQADPARVMELVEQVQRLSPEALEAALAGLGAE